MRSRWFWRTVLFAVLGVPLLATGPYMVAVTSMHGNLLYDFRGGLYNAGVSILHGRDPYWPRFLAHQAAIMHAGGIARGESERYAFSVPVYPAFANLAIIPFSLMPLWVAGTIYTLLSIAAMLAGVRLLGIQDRRCVIAMVICWPFLFGLYLGTIGPFLVLGAGIAWHWRERLWPPALAIATIVATKIFPWPLGVWLLITRRWRALALAVGVGLILTFGAWAAIGFQGLVQYPRMLSDMSFIQEGRAVSIVNLLLAAGLSPGAASVGAVAVAATVLALAWRLARREGADRRAFGLAVLAALASTPIVWEHYMVLLFIPIAMASPQFSWLWLTPVVTPTLSILSSALGGDNSNPIQAYSPGARHGAVAYLLLALVIGFMLCTTAQQRASLRERLPRRSRAGGPLDSTRISRAKGASRVS